MKSAELRQRFLDFFEKKGHKIIPSASLIPENDPTVLFTTAGMHPLVPFLLSQKHPEGKRLTSCQKCIRTGDIDDVGDDTHNTFFEMLGNWSLGDYWKEEAIKWSFEFLTEKLKIPLDRLAISCFAGDNDAPKDEESAKIWESLGIEKERIAFLPKEDNWWGPAGKTGPCGPDTEMFYWKLNDKPAPKVFDAKDKNWVEIWNDVFMQYVKDENGNYLPAKQKNVDTGMGLERTLAVLNGKENIYETDSFVSIIEKIEELSALKYGGNEKLYRIIADHIKASVFLLSEGITPSNLGQGYILRKLIRRQIRSSYALTMKNDYEELTEVIKKMYDGVYPEIKNKKEFIVAELKKEYDKFILTLQKGLKILKDLFEKEKDMDKFGLGDDVIFDLYQEQGFPPELTIEEINRERASRGLRPMDESSTKKLFEKFFDSVKKHQELSRTASAGMFKGGLADNSEATTKLHTAAHLMLAGLKKVLGDNVFQKGSNITAERLRFDFSHKEKLTSEQIRDVENFVNGIIEKDLPVSFGEMSLEKAKEIGAMGVFESKYGEKVKVYTIGKGDEIASREICGGPHVERTGILGHFKITKEESSSSGIRRIKAILK